MSVLVIDAGLDAIEKYGVLGLLYIVLGAIGVFLIRKGDKLVTSIERNTDATTKHTSAVQDLTTNIGVLIQQHERQAREARDQVDKNTDALMAAIKEGLANVRDEIRRPPQ